MNRRHFLKSAAAISVLPMGCTRVSPSSGKRVVVKPAARRVRPGEPGWPSAASWDRLNREVGGRLIEVTSPVAACRTSPNSAETEEFFRNLKNPYYIGDYPALTQTSGWVDAWTSAPSVSSTIPPRVSALERKLIAPVGPLSTLASANEPVISLPASRRTNTLVPVRLPERLSAASEPLADPWRISVPASESSFNSLAPRRGIS